MIFKRSTGFVFLVTLSIYLLRNEQCFAQQNDSANRYDSKYWYEPLNNGVTIKFGQTTDVEKLAVLTNNRNVFLSPNAQSESRFYFSYKFITFKLNYIPKFLKGNDDDAIKGSTKGFGYSFNLNFKRWLQELTYDHTKGFYLENTADFVSGWKMGDPYIQFPELVYNYFQGVTAYNFNKRFSVNALLNQSERQIKSTGSFIPQFLYKYSIIDDRSDPGNNASTQKSNNLELILSGGYYYTLVFNKQFYLSLGVIPGYGYVITKLDTRSATGNLITHQTNTSFRFDGRSGLGYNGRRLFSGISFSTFYSSTKQVNTTVQNHISRNAFQVFIGYRFGEPKILKDLSRKVGL
jgi:hypothetical protein